MVGIARLDLVRHRRASPWTWNGGGPRPFPGKGTSRLRASAGFTIDLELDKRPKRISRETAWVAARTPGRFKDKRNSARGRLGLKKTIAAIGGKMLKAVCLMLAWNEPRKRRIQISVTAWNLWG